MTTTMLDIEPTAEALGDITAITDPTERAWAAESLHRAAAARAKKASGPDADRYRTLANDSMKIRKTAIDLLLAQWDEIQPLDQVDELEKRAWLTEALRQEAKRKAKIARDRRDLAGLVMIEPFVKAVLPTNIEKSKLRRAYESGKLAHDKYYARLEELLAVRHKALAAANVTIEPADVYKPMGVSRARFIQMMEEMPEVLPRMRNATRVMRDSAEEVNRLVTIQSKCRTLREVDLAELLPRYSNADIARLLGLTTARVAQLRQGTR